MNKGVGTFITLSLSLFIVTILGRDLYMNIRMKFLFAIGAVLILLTPGNVWALQCKVCDDGDKVKLFGDGSLDGDYEDFQSSALEDARKYHLIEEICSENTPMTACDEDENVCVTYDIRYEAFINIGYKYIVNVQQYRCGKEDDLTTHCQEYDDWHNEQFNKYYYKYLRNEADNYYTGADIQTCEPQITKKGKY